MKAPWLFLAWAATVAATPVEREWLVLLYGAGDSGKTASVVQHQLEAARQLSRQLPLETVTVLAVHDGPGHDPNWRYELTLTAEPLGEEEVRAAEPSFRYGERDSSHPQTLADFVLWGLHYRPAQRVALVLLGGSPNGAGISDSFRPDTHEAGTLTHSQIGEAITLACTRQAMTFCPLELVVLELPSAGQVEALSEYVGPFRYTLASPVAETVPEIFADTEHWRRLFSSQDTEASLRDIVREYGERSAYYGHPLGQRRYRDGRALVAIRNDALVTLQERLTELSADLPLEAQEAWRKERLINRPALQDSQGNADLLQLLRVLDRTFQQAVERLEPTSWRWLRWNKARERLSRVAAQLPHPPKDPTTASLSIQHPRARVAWVRIPIDTLAPRELSLCIALRSLSTLNPQLAPSMPKFFYQDKPLAAGSMDCLKLREAVLSGKTPRARRKQFVSGEPIREFYGVRVHWPLRAGRLTETLGADRRATSRVLSIAFPRPRQPVKLRPWLPGAFRTRVDYYGKKRRLLKSQTLDGPGYVFSQWENALYVAETHTNGTVFKKGIGIGPWLDPIFEGRAFPPATRLIGE